MKCKKVVYQSLFNTQETFEASNRLWSNLSFPWDIRSLGKRKSNSYVWLKEQWLREKAKRSKCKCKHPMIADGMCFYRNCRHTTGEHY